MTRQRTTACGVMFLLALLCGCARSPQARRDKYLARGKALLEKKDYSRAILEFRNAAKATPQDAEPYYQIGVASEDAGDIRTAVLFFKKALDQNPKHPGAQLKMAQLMVLTNDKAWLQKAETSLNALKQSSSNSSEVLNSLALTELKLGETDKAVQDLQHSLANVPTELRSSVLLAQAKLWQNDAKGAEAILQQAVQADPKSAAPHVVFGEFYLLQKETAAAEQQWRQALAIDPNNGPALLDLARLEFSSGRKQQAEQALRQLSKSRDDQYKPLYAQFLFQENRRDEAIRELKRLADESPEDRQARTRLIAAYEQLGNGSEARKILDKALEKNPKDLDALLQRSEMFIKSGKYDQAQADLNTVIHLKPNSAEAHYVLAQLYNAEQQKMTYRQELSQVLRLNPYLLAARLELARNFVADKQATAALEALDAAPADQKQLTSLIVARNWVLWETGDLTQMRKGIDQALAQERSPDLLIQDGLCKLRSGNYPAARAALEEALKGNPGDVRALAGLTQTYLDQKETAVALQTLTEYASRQPNSAPVQEFLGRMLLIRGDRMQARKAFEAAKAADPRFVDADLSLTQADLLDGKIDEAEKRIRSVLASDAGNKQARVWLANIETMRGNYDAAITSYHEAIEAVPGNAQALNNLAFLLAEYRHQPDAGLKFAQKAVELAPDNPQYLDTLGWVLYEKGLYSPAIPYLEQAAAKGNGPAQEYHLAMAYAKAGNAKRARTVLDTALAKYPNAPEVKAATEVVGQGGASR